MDETKYAQIWSSYSIEMCIADEESIRNKFIIFVVILHDACNTRTTLICKGITGILCDDTKDLTLLKWYRFGFNQY